ncbi:hypothetical protein [Erwinia billingiae]|uniref:hypothetical protein n=1 Tax=Erwinia billingiae TaxID=182337 RepID=UPI0022467091|nr:hypothetical protein [Erwinia billingiae]
MQENCQRITEMKAQTDELLRQLSESEYRSLEIWAKDLMHLKLLFGSFSPYISAPDLLTWLKQHDAVMVSEIAMTGKALMVLQNFFRVASKQR